MLNSNLGHAGFRIGFYLVFVSGFLTWFTEEGTAEHVISLFTLIIGLLFLLVIVVLVKIGRA